MTPYYPLVFACILGFATSHPRTENLAENIVATQSSLADFRGWAANAIDGNDMTDPSKGSCSRTSVESDPWWRVNLHYHYRVYVVKITTSADKALEGANIHIGDCLKNNGTNNAVCASNVSIPAGDTKVIKCGDIGVHGVFVTITIPGTEKCISLCEVELFGAPEPHSDIHHEH
ncbi:fucolectin-5-like [Hemiscyllium ocellatum]|uniref:fucolectin-5-like n=1 Tax=Hemiscyllium ocellatum TaxID=170820 RepID=UPI00296741F9|nr:fucolectin-5-like [Hemiscyllium ocellatum]